tara:strand:- start:10996 stop:12753 length:1758 start_codon:yes stop_codon:yes gene_type:complete
MFGQIVLLLLFLPLDLMATNNCLSDIKGVQEKAQELLKVADCSASSLYQCAYDTQGVKYFSVMMSTAGLNAAAKVNALGVVCKLSRIGRPLGFPFFDTAVADSCRPLPNMKKEVADLLNESLYYTERNLNRAGYAWLNDPARAKVDPKLKQMIDVMQRPVDAKEYLNISDTMHKRVFGYPQGSLQTVEGVKPVFSIPASRLQNYKNKYNYQAIGNVILRKGTSMLDGAGSRVDIMEKKWAFLKDPAKTLFYSAEVDSGYSERKAVLNQLQRLKTAQTGEEIKRVLDFLENKKASLSKLSLAKLEGLRSAYNASFCKAAAAVNHLFLPHAHAKACQVRYKKPPKHIAGQYFMKARADFDRTKMKKLGGKGLRLMGGTLSAVLSLASVEATAKCDVQSVDWAPLDADCQPQVSGVYPGFYEFLNDIAYDDEMFSSYLKSQPYICQAILKIHNENFGDKKSLQCQRSGAHKMVEFQQDASRYRIRYENGKIQSYEIIENGKTSVINYFDEMGYLRRTVFRSNLKKRGLKTVGQEVYNYKNGSPVDDSPQAWAFMQQAGLEIMKLIKAEAACEDQMQGASKSLPSKATN